MGVLKEILNGGYGFLKLSEFLEEGVEIMNKREPINEFERGYQQCLLEALECQYDFIDK